MVIVGGWAHRLLRYHPLAQVVPHDPLLTLDTDIAIPVTLDTDIAIPATLDAREQDLRGRLKASGFEEKFLGENQPPATHYELADERGEFYAEFLSPLIGSEYDRDGNRRECSLGSRVKLRCTAVSANCRPSSPYTRA